MTLLLSVGRGVPSAGLPDSAENRKIGAGLPDAIVQVQAVASRTGQERSDAADTNGAHDVPSPFGRPYPGLSVW